MVTSTRSETVFEELQVNVFMIEYIKAKCGTYCFNQIQCIIDLHDPILDASESLEYYWNNRWQ